MKTVQVLVTDPITEEGLKPLTSHSNFKLERLKDTREIQNKLNGCEVLLVRSETKVTEDLLLHAKNLKLIGRAGVGVDNINLAAASRKGILVMNVPGGNTIAAAEHTWALILALSRNIPQADVSVKAGKWEREKWIGSEVSGKTLGLIGLGHIGKEVAKRALAFGMKVIAHDPYVSKEHGQTLGVQLVEIKELFRQSDYTSLHTPLNDQTHHLINKNTLEQMKPGARLINCARGGLVDETALATALKSGWLRGAALDVFEKEPPKNSPLIGFPNVIFTPHLGASTEEAQVKVAQELAQSVLDYYERGILRNVVNLPGFEPAILESLGPYLPLAEKMGKFLSQVVEGGFKQIQLGFYGDFSPNQRPPLTIAALKGLLSSVVDEPITLVSAPLIASERGIRTLEIADPSGAGGFKELLTVSVKTDKEERKIGGTVLGPGGERIVLIDDLSVDVRPEGKMLVLVNQDRPGMIGRVGTLLGHHHINIADMRVGRKHLSGNAVMVITVDNEVPETVFKEFLKIPGISRAQLVQL